MILSCSYIHYYTALAVTAEAFLPTSIAGGGLQGQPLLNYNTPNKKIRNSEVPNSPLNIDITSLFEPKFTL